MATWTATAPSNIALIKYMGKRDAERNIPTNASLSYTLPHLTSTVSLCTSNEPRDHWAPLSSEGFTSALTDKAIQRFLSHLALIKTRLGYSGCFAVRSANNFPMGCGLASSASSFAALTQCAIQAICQLTGQPHPTDTDAAVISRRGSGSSCRSFFQPWAMWEDSNVMGLDLPYRNLYHCVIVLDKHAKVISSSEAHKRVQTSPSFAGRSERANQRCQTLIHSLKRMDWPQVVTICRQEFLDMHHLFETATPKFSYMNDATQHALRLLEQQWSQQDNGPIVTMDAGPNIHLLYRAEDKQLATSIVSQCHQVGWQVLHA